MHKSQASSTNDEIYSLFREMTFSRFLLGNSSASYTTDGRDQQLQGRRDVSRLLRTLAEFEAHRAQMNSTELHNRSRSAWESTCNHLRRRVRSGKLNRTPSPALDF
jgi:hypothetical protein